MTVMPRINVAIHYYDREKYILEPIDSAVSTIVKEKTNCGIHDGSLLIDFLSPYSADEISQRLKRARI